MKTMLLLLLGLLFLTGCVTLYKPNAIYSPLLKDKGDFNASAALGVSECGLINLQSAYAVSDHAAIMMDGMYHTRRTSSADTSVEKINISFVEAGAGYFTKLGNKKNLLFQCYGGAGTGAASDKINYPNSPDPNARAEYYNLFVQPGFAFTGKYFEAAFDLRANYVHLYNVNAYLYEAFEWWNTDSDYYENATIDFMNLEPTVTLKAGKGKLKGMMQLGWTIPTINSDSYYNVNSSTIGVPFFIFTLGISYTIPGK